MRRRRSCTISAATCSPISRNCRCAFFDTRRHGDIMSYFTNDVDTVADALNNSFAMAIQSFIQMTGTLVLLFVLNWQLSLIVVLGYAAMFLYIRFSARRSTSYYTAQQAAIGDVNGYIEEMVAGQKIIKVFNHEAENKRGFFCPERSAAQGRYRRAELRRHHGPGGRQHLVHQLCHRCGGGRPDGAARPDRHRQPFQLSRLCAPGRHADQPVHPAEQLPAGGHGGRRAHLRDHAPGPGNGRRQDPPGQCARRKRRC